MGFNYTSVNVSKPNNLKEKDNKLNLSSIIYQQKVARATPVTKKWKTNTENMTKTACAAL